MNIMFFLKPKAEVSYLYDYNTIIKGLEKMQAYNFAGIPVIDKEGRYVGTVTQGDFLWKLVELGSVRNAASENVLVKDILKADRNVPLGTNASVDDVLNRAMDQNFVPVVDSRNMFIGIVTRRDILRYFRDVNGQL
jgi:hypothetical protein